MRIDFLKPDPRTISAARFALHFYAQINRVENTTSENTLVCRPVLALGFGTKGETLKKNYVLTLIGEEEFDSRKTVVLELTPNPTRCAARSPEFACGSTKHPGCQYSRNSSKPAPTTTSYPITRTQ